MKSFIIALCIVGLTMAEPPRFRSSRLRSRFFARQEALPDAEATTPAAEGAPYAPARAPYPPSGWKPVGQSFELPTPEEQALPEETPVDVYIAPDDAYGVPTTLPTDLAQEEEEDETTTEPLSESINTDEEEKVGRLRRPLKSQRQVLRNDRNAFYVLLPDNTLQRVEVKQLGARVTSRFPARLLQEVRF